MPIDPTEINTTVAVWLAGGLTIDQITGGVGDTIRAAALADIASHIPERPTGFDAEVVAGIIQSFVQLAALTFPFSPSEAIGDYIAALKTGSSDEALTAQWNTACLAIGSMVIASGRAAELAALLDG